MIPVEEHLGLARKIAWKYRGAAEQEELLSAAYLGLTKAGLQYQPEIGSAFSTFACVVIENEIRIFLRNERRWRGMVSLEDQIPWAEGLTLQDIIPDEADLFNFVEDRLHVEEILENGVLALEERRLLRLYYQERKSQREIGKAMGISQSLVSRKLRTAKEKLKKEWADDAATSATRKT